MLSYHPPQRAVTSSTSFYLLLLLLLLLLPLSSGENGGLCCLQMSLVSGLFNRRDKFPYEIYKPWKQLQSRSEREALNYVKTRVPLLTEGSVSVATRKGRKKQMNLSWNDVFFPSGKTQAAIALLLLHLFIPPCSSLQVKLAASRTWRPVCGLLTTCQPLTLTWCTEKERCQK